MNIDWSLLGPPVDVGAHFQEGIQHGRAMRIQGAQDSALAALAKDPANESALAGLTSVNPAMGMQLRDLADKRTLRTGLAEAFDPSTGRVDPVRARQAYASAGDVDGAMEVETGQAELQSKLTKAQQDQFRLGAQLLEGVKDEASYQQARSMAQQMGMDLSEIPEAYDPQYVQSVQRVGRALGKTGGSATAPNIQREVEYYRSIGRPELADQLLERHAEGPPLLIRNPDDGTVEVVSPGGARPGGSASPPPAALEYLRQHPETKAHFDAKYGAGSADRALGGPSQPGSGTFP